MWVAVIMVDYKNRAKNDYLRDIYYYIHYTQTIFISSNIGFVRFHIFFQL